MQTNRFLQLFSHIHAVPSPFSFSLSSSSVSSFSVSLLRPFQSFQLHVRLSATLFYDEFTGEFVECGINGCAVETRVVLQSSLHSPIKVNTLRNAP